MRFSVLLLGWLAPQLALAQVFKTVEVGSYVLSTAPQVRQQGGLYLRSSEQLVVRDLAGKTATLSPQQVSSFQVGNQRFVTTGGFQLRSGFGDTFVQRAFAEQLDSGQVVLLRYQSPASNAPARGNIGYSNGPTGSIYLLRQSDSQTVTVVYTNWSKKNRHFQQALRPYLASRPDLLSLLASNALAPSQVPGVIHALNTHSPYGGSAATGTADK